MPSKRPRYDGLDDEQEQEQEQNQGQQVEHTTSVKVTWIANHLHQSLNEKREQERERLNRRLANGNLPPRPPRTIQRPRGEAGRTGTTSSGQRRSGFVLKEFLQRESNLNDIHYTMIQNTVHRLAARHLDIRRTWRENQGNGLVTVCLEAAKLHPCLYDYDAFWPVHDHLKQHLKSTRDKYDYVDPDLAPLNAAEEAAKEVDEPPPRKKRRTTDKGKKPNAYRSLAPSPDPSDRSVLLPPLQRTFSSQPRLPARPPQRTNRHFETGVGSSKANDKGSLMTLRGHLMAEGHQSRGDGTLSLDHAQLFSFILRDAMHLVL